MKKRIVLMILTSIIALPLFAGEQIAIRVKAGPYTGSRSESAVTASIDEQVLTVSFIDVTESSIVVYDATDPDTVLFSQNYAPAYSAQADLTSLPAGEYAVEIYAFDEWWIGDFEID